MKILANLILIIFALSGIGCGTSSFDYMDPQSHINEDDPSPLKSSMVVSYPNYADGATPAWITLKILSNAGKPLVGMNMTLWVSGQSNTVVPCPPTDLTGVARCKIYSTFSEIKHVKAMGAITLESEAMFIPLKATQNVMGIVSSGGTSRAPLGNKVLSSSGVIESSMRGRDSANKLRMKTSVVGLIIENN